MPKLVAVVGLPGSGKSHYVKERAASENLEAFPDFLSGYALHRGMFGSLVTALIRGRDCIVDHVSFCHEPNRKHFERFLQEAFGMKPEWVFFENDFATCLTNVLGDRAAKNREDLAGRHHSLEHHAKELVVPEGVKALPVKAIYKIERLP